MRDVAKRANVTPMTVSRVINNSGYVKDSTRSRVERAIKELNYVPNLLGQSLRFNKTHTVGLIISDISNPYWTQIIKGVEQTITKTQYNIFLCDSQSSESKEMDHIENLIKKQVDGILIAPIVNMSKPIEFVQRQQVPIVVIGYPMPSVKVDVVGCVTYVAVYYFF
jgi:LacI family transcriptional regulator